MKIASSAAFVMKTLMTVDEVQKNHDE